MEENKKNKVPNVPNLRFPHFIDRWVKKKVRDLTKTSTGATPKTSKAEYWNGNIRWMNSGELNLKHIYEVEGRITKLGYNSTSTKMLPVNCVLIGLAGQGKTRGTCAINHVELCTNQSIAAIWPCMQLNSLFLYYNLESRYKELREISSGEGGRGGLNLPLINNLYIPMCSLEEQSKIATFLNLIEERIATQNKIIEELERLKKSIYQSIAVLCREIKKEQLISLCTITTGKRDANEGSIDGQYPFFTCSKETTKIGTYTFDGPSLLISGNGEIGQVKYYNGKFDAYQRTYVLQNFVLNPLYVKIWLEIMLPARIHREQNVGAMPYIVISTLADLFIPVTDISMQNKIVNVIKSVESKIQENKKLVIFLEKQKCYLLNNLFI